MSRLLVIMGSGETSPTMVKTHRELLRRLGPGPVPAALLDTPFGFQANADDITARAVDYFRKSVGEEMGVASFRGPDTDLVEHENMLTRLREARYVFSGPGSPTYALRVWKGSQVPRVLAEKLRSGGCITFASAAALTLGAATVPVYEIYKVGQDPHWLEGLDLLGEIGLAAAVIPHFDNAEGGGHDTRYCYLGEERLARMEEQLADEVFVLGVDEHTAVIFDLEAGTAGVVGLGAMTVRKDGKATSVGAGSTVPIASLAELAAGAARPGPAQPAPVARSAPPAPGGHRARSPLLAAVAERETAFSAALAAGDVDGAVRAVLQLEEELGTWVGDTTQSDEMDRGRAALRSMVARLGDLARRGVGDPAQRLGPFVQLLVDQRAAARAAGRWAEADALRDRLAGLGVEVRDTSQGTTWRLLS